MVAMQAVVVVASLTVAFFATVSAWNVTRLYGTPLRARLVDVAVWRNKAYVCWPRLEAAQPVTLLELPWPETKERPRSSSSSSPSSRWSPHRPFLADQQKLDDCRFVQSAVAVDLDKIRGHLYVLDGGYFNNSCAPKIVVYDLKTNKIIQSTELGGLNGSESTSLTVDARPFRTETRVYVGNARGGFLVVFEPYRSAWYRVLLTFAGDRQDTEKDEADVPAERVAVSKLTSTVFLTSARSHSFYSFPLRDLRNSIARGGGGGSGGGGGGGGGDDDDDDGVATAVVKNGDLLSIGLRVCREDDKIGNSSDLYVDIQGGLNYVYTNAFVVFRFVPGAGGVEEHKVILQSRESLPAVAKIFTDNLNYLQVWALNAVPNAKNRHTVKINTLFKL